MTNSQQLQLFSTVETKNSEVTVFKKKFTREKLATGYWLLKSDKIASGNSGSWLLATTPIRSSQSSQPNPQPFFDNNKTSKLVLVSRKLSKAEKKTVVCSECKSSAVELRDNKPYCFVCLKALDYKMPSVIRLECDYCSNPTVLLSENGSCFCLEHAKELV